MSRSPHASHLHPNWGKDALWHAGIGIPITSDDVKSVNLSPTIDLVGVPVSPPTVLPKVQLTVIHPNPCFYLGKVVTRVGCSSCRRDDTRVCNFKEFEGKLVTQNTVCEFCTVYLDGSP